MSSDEDSEPKRGDLVEVTLSDMEDVGIVMGWIDKESFCVYILSNNTIVACPYESQNFELLISLEKLKNPRSWLPVQVSLSDSRVA